MRYINLRLTYLLTYLVLVQSVFEGVDRWCFNDRLWEFVPFIDDPDTETEQVLS